MMRDLTQREIRFCDEYIICFNATQAAIKAGYSKKTARTQGSKLLTKVDIQRYLKTKKKRILEKLDVAAEDVINELRIIGFARTTDFATIDDVEVGKGKRKKVVRMVVAHRTSDIDPDKLPALAELKQTKDGIGIKTHDKVRALDLLGKHLGIFDGEEPNDGTIRVKIV